MQRRNDSISCFQIDFLMSSLFLLSVVFSNVNPNSTRKEILLYLVSFSPLEPIVNSFLHVQFSRLLLEILSRGKGTIKFLAFLSSCGLNILEYFGPSFIQL